MTAQEARAASISPDVVRRLSALLRRLDEHARRAGRDDLAELLAGLPLMNDDGPLRVVTVGETKRGKSTLVNSLVGRPDLSPVGVDVTTSCWVEVTFGDAEGADVVMADRASPGEPVRLACELREVESFAVVTNVHDPVLGVELRVNAALLRDLALIDTPGVGGLQAGHSRTTLTALGRADALLFVCDARQPILAPEVEFLVEAAARVPTVVVAVTKCDLNPGYEVVVEETRRRLGQIPELRDAPVFAVAPPLSDRAAEVEDEETAALFRELSGMDGLSAALTERARAGTAAVRYLNSARSVGYVGGVLADQAEEVLSSLAGGRERSLTVSAEVDRLTGLIDHGSELGTDLRSQLAALGREPVAGFSDAVEHLRRRYRDEAQRGPAAQLTTLAPRMMADVTAAGMAALQQFSDASAAAVTRVLASVSGSVAPAQLPMGGPPAFQLRWSEPAAGGRNLASAVTTSAGVFANLLNVLVGSAAVVSVLTGPGVVAACLALAAGTGWWKVRGEDEQQRRTQLGSWVDDSGEYALAGFRDEVDRRTTLVTHHVEVLLPQLLAARRGELEALTAEVRRLRADEAALKSAAVGQRDRIAELRLLSAEANALASEVASVAGTAVG
jgi:hypothetical protein